MNFTLNEQDMTQRMKKGWRGGLKENTACGEGSTMPHTEEIRIALPKIFKEYGITSMNDAGCGDQHWVHKTEFPAEFDYQGYDLIQRHPDAIPLDITTELMRDADLVMCRDVFIHLTEDRIKAAINNFRDAGCKYLLASSYLHNENTLSRPGKMFTRISLIHEPFNFPEPLLRIEEPKDKRWMGLWCLKDI